MDPVTAINNAIAETFKFLGTDQGQGIVADIRAVNKDFASKVMDLIDHLHRSVTASKPASPAA